MYGIENGATSSVKVYKNPSFEEMKLLISKFQQKEARGFLLPSNGDVFVWDSYGAYHDNLIYNLIDQGIIKDKVYDITKFYFQLTHKGNITLSSFYGKMNQSQLENYPSMQRILDPQKDMVGAK